MTSEINYDMKEQVNDFYKKNIEGTLILVVKMV